MEKKRINSDESINSIVSSIASNSESIDSLNDFHLQQIQEEEEKKIHIKQQPLFKKREMLKRRMRDDKRFLRKSPQIVDIERMINKTMTFINSDLDLNN